MRNFGCLRSPEKLILDSLVTVGFVRNRSECESHSDGFLKLNPIILGMKVKLE